MESSRYFLIIGVSVLFLCAFSAHQILLSKSYKTGKIRFVQELVLDDGSMPENLFFERPTSVVCDQDDNIYVLDSDANNIKKFDSNGKFIKSSNIPYDEGSVRKLRSLPTGEIVVEKEKSYRRDPDKPQICTIDLYSRDLEYVRIIYERSLWRKKYIRTREYGISTLYFPYSPDVHWDVSPEGKIIIGFSENYFPLRGYVPVNIRRIRKIESRDPEFFGADIFLSPETSLIPMSLLKSLKGTKRNILTA